MSDAEEQIAKAKVHDRPCSHAVEQVERLERANRKKRPLPPNVQKSPFDVVIVVSGGQSEDEAVAPEIKVHSSLSILRYRRKCRSTQSSHSK